MMALGCGQEAPIEPAVIAQRAAVFARNAGLQTASGLGFAGGNNSTMRSLTRELDAALTDLQAALPSPVPSPVLDALANNSFITALTDAKSTVNLDQRITDVSVQLERWVKERLLADPNLVSKTDDAAVYLLKGDPTCRPLVAPGAPIPAVDADCAAALNRIAVHVYMKALLDGVSLRFTVGPDELEMSTVILRVDGLEWRADWSKAAAATDFVNATLEQGGGKMPAEKDGKFRKLSGQTVLKLQREGSAGISVTVSIVKPLVAIKANAAKQDTAAITIASSTTPVLSISGDGALKTAAVEVALGATELRMPWDPSHGGAANTAHGVSFSSFSARGHLAEKTRTLELMDISVRDLREDVRGTKTASIALNPSAMNKLSLTASLDADGLAHLQVSPKLEIVGDFHLAHLEPDFPAPKPYLPEETMKLVLDGAAGVVPQLVVYKQDGVFAGIQVNAGQLTISSTKAKDAVKVATGRCLTPTNTLAPDAHPLLGRLLVIDCPGS